MGYWLFYSEPGTRSWDDLVEASGDGLEWNGLRDDDAFDCLMQMQKGDLALVYHAGDEQILHGMAKLTSAAHADSTDDDNQWLSVDAFAFIRLINQLNLAQCRADERLAQMPLVMGATQPVQPVSEDEWRTICELAGMPRMVEAG